MLRKANIIELFLHLEAELLQQKDISKFYIEKLEISGTVFYSPCNMLSFMTFAEFIYIDTLYMNYIENKKAENLHKLIAIIYRPGVKTFNEKALAERRIKFDDALLNYYSQLFSEIAQEYKDFIFYNWSLIRQWLTKIYPHVFGGTEKSVKTEINDGWLNVRDFLATNISDIDKVDNTPLHDVLRRLNNQLKK